MKVKTAISPIAHGSRSAMAWRLSMSVAVGPPTSTCLSVIFPRMSRTRCSAASESASTDRYTNA